MLLAWDAEPIGVDEQGVVHGLGSGGGRLGRLPGRPQALLADEGSIYAAAEADGRSGIYGSVDGGRTWRLRYRDPA